MIVRLPDILISCFFIITIVTIHLFSAILRSTLGGAYSHKTLSQLIEAQAKEYSWFLKLLVNCFGYSCIFVPGYLIYKCVQRTNYLEKNGTTCIYKIICMCITGNTYTNKNVEYHDDTPESTKIFQGALPLTSNTTLHSTNKLKRPQYDDILLLLWCFSGLMVSYLTWGVLQEKIMTQEYYNFSGNTMHFKDSQFLVFCNRVLAFVVAVCSLPYQRTVNVSAQHAPLYKYSFASISNIMSAWFQYEALKFVNFPTQVLAKSCKIIPVMLMGKILSQTKYEVYEYVTAILISVGMIFFMTGSADKTNVSNITTVTGVFLLAMYMIFDSFTANWQSRLFKSYGMTSLQMMCGVNLFSTIFTASSLSIQGSFIDSLAFATEHPKFVVDIIVLSISSAIGQLFIFYTISVFGPVVFTIIMTLRQAVAIMLSCLIYHHRISHLGIFGVTIVFFAVFLRVYYNQRMKIRRQQLEILNAKITV